MQKTFFALLFTFMCTSTLFAQSDSLKTEIGFSTQFIFNYISSSSNAPFDLLLKQQAGKNSWMRYGLSAYYSTNNLDDLPDLITSENSHLYLMAIVGVEKRRALSAKWLVLYGADLQASYTRNNSFRISSSNMGNRYEESEHQNTMYGGGLRPFVGIGFNITPRLYISTEASAFVRTQFGTTDAKRIVRDMEYDINTSEERKGELSSSSIGVTPASAIFVYYKF